MDLGPIEKAQSSVHRLFPSKSVNLGLKHDLHGLFLSQIGSSLHVHFAVGHLKLNSSSLHL